MLLDICVFSPMHKLWVRQWEPSVWVLDMRRKTPSFSSLLVLPASSHCPHTCAPLLGVFGVCDYPDQWKASAAGSLHGIQQSLYRTFPWECWNIGCSSSLEKLVHSLCTGNLNLPSLVSAGWWGSGQQWSPASSEVPGLKYIAAALSYS